MEYRILGPLAVLAGGHELSLGGRKQRRILALLLLRAGRSVDVDELAEAVWGADVPVIGRRQVRNAVGALRTKLIKAGGMIDNRERAAEAAWQEAFALFSDMGMPEAGELAHQVRSSVARPETHP